MDLYRHDLDRLLARIADREPHLRLAAYGNDQNLRPPVLVTHGPLAASRDQRILQADHGIEIDMRRGDSSFTASFHWAVNFGVEQLCVWRKPLGSVYPGLIATVDVHEVPRRWPGWPHGGLVAADGFKLRPSEEGLKGVDFTYGHGRLRICTDDLSQDVIVSEPTSVLLICLDPDA